MLILKLTLRKTFISGIESSVHFEFILSLSDIILTVLTVTAVVAPVSVAAVSVVIVAVVRC